jgi:hypothetical protein
LEITLAALSRLAGGPLPEYVPTGIVCFSDDPFFSVLVDPPDAAEDPSARTALFLAVFNRPDCWDLNWSCWARRGRTWALTPELVFAVAIDPDAAPGNPIPALARVLRRLAGTAVNR